ncbi:MAG: hypothetical protein C5B51_31790 [Terriglobia bacterium]|nr:MAG: hypothetical protein C5B51_31790 [Terriglobia bacterium]
MGTQIIAEFIEVDNGRQVNRPTLLSGSRKWDHREGEPSVDPRAAICSTLPFGVQIADAKVFCFSYSCWK